MDQAKVQILIEYLQANPQEIPAVIGQINKINAATATTTENTKKATNSLFQQRMAYMELAHTGRATMDLLILGGNNPRMLLAQVPQAVQGLTMLGIGLSTLIPIIAGIAAVAGAGYLVWYEYTAGERAAAKAADELHKELKGVADIMDQIQKRQQAGLLGQTAADEFKKYLSGEIPLYKNRSGQTTRSATDTIADTATAYAGPGVPITYETGKMKEVENVKATYAEIQKYVADILNVQGKIDAQQVDALIKLRELQKSVHADALSQLDQEKLAITKKHEEERRVIELNLAEARKVMTLRQIGEAESAIAQSKSNEAREIREKDYEFQKKNLQEQDKIQQSILDRSITRNKTSSGVAQKLADDDLKTKTITAEEWRDKSLSILNKSIADEKAAALVKYDTEKALRTKLSALTSNPIERQRLRAEGIADENSYQQKILQINADAATKKLKILQDTALKTRQLEEIILHTLEAENRQLEEQTRAQLALVDAEKQRQDMKTHPEGVNNGGLSAANGLSSIFDKTLPARIKILQGYFTSLEKEGKKFADEMAKMQLAPPGTFTDADFERLQQQIEENKRKQIQAAEEIKSAEAQVTQQRLAGVSNMFGGMAQAAKAFGKEGFAAYKAFAIAQAAIDTARAAIAAYQSVVGIPYVGPILAPIAAAAAVAAGAAQIANIEAQSYATGGLIEGPGTGTSDTVPIRASNREYMIRNAVVEQPGALEFLHEFNARGMDVLGAGRGNFVGGTGTGTRSVSGPGKGSASGRSGNQKISVGFVETRNHLRRFMRGEGTKLVLDGFSERGNQVAA